MNTYMRTSPIEITEEFDYQDGKAWVVRTTAPVDDGTDFEFEVFNYGTDELVLGGIAQVEDRYYMEEIIQWYRAHQGHLRYSFVEEYLDE